MTAASLSAELAALPGERFVAEVDGEVVGWAPAFHRADGAVSFWIGVLPAFRRRGLGAALFSALSPQLDGVRSRAYADGEDGGRFLAARGYAAAGQLHLATLDLDAASRASRAVPGFRAVPLARAARPPPRGPPPLRRRPRRRPARARGLASALRGVRRRGRRRAPRPRRERGRAGRRRAGRVLVRPRPTARAAAPTPTSPARSPRTAAAGSRASPRRIRCAGSARSGSTRS